MALRRMLGWSDGELMRSDAKPCTRLMRQTAGIHFVGGSLAAWILCRLHYGHLSLSLSLSCIERIMVTHYKYCLMSKADNQLGYHVIIQWTITSDARTSGHESPRITIPRALRWAGCGAVSASATSALLVRLFSPECEPQNIAAYDIKK
ncbi:hypothetical protein RJ641_020853 [Dillenia turbinata]|uniref:DUF7875 domain-containing protein n=1 Tax=Dillenia turbinata TaxID=194707 RepID=A0AAN8YWL8_9MAGN